MEHNDTIQQGAGFYRELALFSDKQKTQAKNITGRVPRSTLMKEDGTFVASFQCSVLAYYPARIAWTMPPSSTSIVDPDVQYIHCIDLDNTEDATDIQRAVEGVITVRRGQVKS